MAQGQVALRAIIGCHNRCAERVKYERHVPPHPCPLPHGEGERIVSRALRNLTRQMYSSGGVRGSLSFGERAGVRGNGAYSNRTSQMIARTVALLESPNRDGASRRIP
jgi:hypothetical protein